MDPIKTRIINRFLQDHKRLLGGALLPTGQVHPNDVVHVGDVGLKPNSSNKDSLDFSATFQVGRINVSYFGTIASNWSITNEAVTGRKSDGI